MFISGAIIRNANEDESDFDGGTSGASAHFFLLNLKWGRFNCRFPLILKGGNKSVVLRGITNSSAKFAFVTKLKRSVSNLSIQIGPLLVILWDPCTRLKKMAPETGQIVTSSLTTSNRRLPGDEEA